MPRSLKPTRNSTIGLVLLILAVVMLAYGLAGKPNPFANPRIVYAQFSNVSTIIRFDRNVQVDGVDVGSIGKITRQGNHALVQLKVDRSVGTIYANATAAIRPHTIFDGNSYVELDPGTPSAPPLGNRPIPLSHTRNYVSLDLFLRTFNPRVRTALPRVFGDAHAALSPTATSALRQATVDSPALFRSLSPALRALQGPTGQELAGAVVGSAKTLRAVTAAEHDLGPALSTAAQTFNGFRAGDTALDQTFAQLPGALHATAVDSAAVQGTITRLHQLAGPLTTGVRQLPHTLRVLRPWLLEAAPEFRTARPFVSELHNTLVTAAHAAPPTSRLLSSVMPGLNQLHSSLIRSLMKTTPFGGEVYQELAGMISGAAGTMAYTQTPSQATPSNEGSGHLWSLSSPAPAGIGCSTLTGSLQTTFKELGLCSP